MKHYAEVTYIGVLLIAAGIVAWCAFKAVFGFLSMGGYL